jgi:hypothetical protein
MCKLKDWLLSLIFNTVYLNQETGEITNKEGEIIGKVIDGEINYYSLNEYLHHKKKRKQ